VGRRFEPDRAHVSSLQPKKDNSWLPIYLALGAVWGCSFIFIKLGLEFLTPFGVAFGRCALGALTLLTWAKYKGIALPKSKAMLFHLWVVSLLLNVIPGILFALAQTEVTSILAGIINAVTPLMTLLAIMLVTRDEKPKIYQVVGILIGFIGVLTVLGAWKGLGDNPLWAILILLAAVTCYGFSFPYSRRFILPHKLQPESIAAGQVTLGALTLIPLFIYNGIDRYEFQTAPVLAMLALGVFGSGFAYIWNFKVMANAGSAIASSVTYLTPVVAVIVGVIFLQESIYWYEPVGALIVLLGAAIGQNRIKLRVI
jgi:drug/metabolite transporter (DMT)-like permease